MQLISCFENVNIIAEIETCEIDTSNVIRRGGGRGAASFFERKIDDVI